MGQHRQDNRDRKLIPNPRFGRFGSLQMSHATAKYVDMRKETLGVLRSSALQTVLLWNKPS